MTNGVRADKCILPPLKFQALDLGVQAAGYKVFVYEAGTTTKATTWTDATGTTQNTNPVILDEQGQANIWVLPENPDPATPNPPGPPGPQGPAGPPGPPGATGNTAEFSATIDITSETIYTAFNGEFIELVPAPNANQMIVPVMVAISYKYATVPYETNSGNFVVSWGPPTFPSIIPSGVIPATLLEGVTDAVLFMPSASIDGQTVSTVDGLGKNLTLTLDAAPDGAPLISISVSDGGSGYVAGDTGTIDGGDANATYEVLTETAGVVDTVSLTAGGTGYSSVAAESTAVGGGQPGIGTGLLLDTASALLSSGTLRVQTNYRLITQQA